MNYDTLKACRLFLLDMDGTLYLGDEVFPGAVDFIGTLAKTGRRYIYLTNNSSRAGVDYVNRLRGLGFPCEAENVFTSGMATGMYLNQNHPGAKVYLNGTPVLEENWKAKGIHLVKEDPDVAVQSFDTTLTYEKLDRICHYVRNGVPFIATHMDTNCPTEYGFMPDCGAMCSLITDSTGVKPRFLGKPWKETVDMVAEITGYKAEEMAFVGDRLYTDVATGVNNGAKGFLVLTGEADMQTVAESDVEPTCIYDSLKEMRKYL